MSGGGRPRARPAAPTRARARALPSKTSHCSLLDDDAARWRRHRCGSLRLRPSCSRSSHQQRAANDAAEEHAEEALATARDVLGLPPPPTALSEAQVDRAYKDQARKLHPDRSCDAADATKRMQEVVAARDVLKDYLQRDREFTPDEVV